jgi:hypothetical protein
MELDSRIKENFLLSFLSYWGCWMTETKRIHRGIDSFLETLETSSLLQKRYSLAWGPSVHQHDDQAHNDALLFAVRWANELTIVIRGTSIFSPSTMILQDLLIRQKIPWKKLFPQRRDIPQHAGISESTFRGLTLLTQLQSQPTNGSPPQSILDFIKKSIEETPDIIINITGHSLGGCLSAPMALWLADSLEARLDGQSIPPIRTYAFAGPTPGDIGFNDYYESRLPGSYTSYKNKLDPAPYVWDMQSLSKLPELPYFKKQDDKELIYIASQMAHDMEYKRMEGDIEGEGEQLKLAPFLLQAVWQHTIEYFILLFGKKETAQLMIIFDKFIIKLFGKFIARSIWPKLLEQKGLKD